MFDSQICSLTTITYLIQFFAIATVVGFRLRVGCRFNGLGLLSAIGVMSISCLVCLCIDPAAGVVQGVTLVGVASLTSYSPQEVGDAAF